MGEAVSESQKLVLWRSVALALMTFIMGAAIPMFTFGWRAATRADIQAVQQAQAAHDQKIEDRLEGMEKAVNYMAGEIHSAGLDK